MEVTKKKKRKHESLSGSESESNQSTRSRESGRYVMSPLRIKRELKTPQREIVSNVKKKVESEKLSSTIRIKKERLTPAREIRRATQSSSSDSDEEEAEEEVPFKIRKLEVESTGGQAVEEFKVPDKQQRKKIRKSQEMNEILENSLSRNNNKVEKKKKKRSGSLHSESTSQTATSDSDGSSFDNSQIINSNQVLASSSFMNESDKSKGKKKEKKSANNANSVLSELKSPGAQNYTTEFNNAAIAHSSTMSYNSDRSFDNLNASTISQKGRSNNLTDADESMMKDIEDKIRSQSSFSLTEKEDPKETLASLYPDLRPRDIPVKLKFSEHEYVHLIRIPKCVDPSLLLNATIRLNGHSKIKIDNEKYVFESTEMPPHASLVIGEDSKILDFKSNIFMKKYIKPAKIPQLSAEEKTSVPLPDNLKERHPLFGVNFEDKIFLSEETQRKLNEAIENARKEEEKLKRKKLKKKKNNESDHSQEIIFDLLNAHETKSNKVVKKAMSDSAESSKSKDDLVRDTLRNVKQEMLSEWETESVRSFKKKKKKKEKVQETGNMSVVNDSINDSKNDTVSEILKNMKQELFLENMDRVIKKEKNKKSKKSIEK